jgi:O-antigen ligase
MPEHLRTLAVILVLATGIFMIAKAPTCYAASSTSDFERRRNIWYAITLTAFLAHNFWLYIIFTAAIISLSLPKETNRIALYFFVLLAVPPIRAQITGLGAINHFFEIDYLRLLALVILLPTFISIQSKPTSERFGRLLPDKLLVAYLALQCLLLLQANSLTNTLRVGVFYGFIDIFLPYYVVSRSLKSLSGFRDALVSFVIPALVLSAIAFFEFIRYWLLYAPLESSLGATWGYGGYLAREGSLRAQASTGHPIVMGYVFAVAIGFSLFLRISASSPTKWWLALGLLITGLIASLSRGPWVGAAAMLLAFIVTGPSSMLRLTKLAIFVAMGFLFILATPLADKIISFLPFIGTVESETISYRQKLLENSIYILLQNPFFGAYDFIYSPAMQEMKQGQGIIDLVNTYLVIGLSSGLVGLGLFIGAFAVVAIKIIKRMKKLTDRNGEEHILGQALLATLAGVMIIIFTVSSINAIPVIYWSIAGLGVAYGYFLQSQKTIEDDITLPVDKRRASITQNLH